MAFLTPLRYPGGKGRMGPWIAELLRHNQISGGWYVEPYAGGCGAALFLLAHGYVDRIVINDADPVIFSFWKAVTEQVDELIAKIKATQVSMVAWQTQREILATSANHSQLDVAFAAFFLNRTNRSGILAGGVIGGKSQSGAWKLGARYNKEDLIERIRAIGKLAKRISVYGLDALDLLDIVVPKLPKKSLIYLDPPYFQKGSQLYRNFYGPDDHAVIAQRVANLKVPVIVTYDKAKEISELYRSFDQVEFSLQYSTHRARPQATELLIYRNLSLQSAPELTRRQTLRPTCPHKTANVVPQGIHELAV
ncbi:MAG: DNA adenine methylase [Azonexus sp.]|jgi:DNA adenine methylase|uniref:DNA adenine methylase n=1 Tax=Azonexus sp. TaxID=1872668 RepID=UPI00282CC148|nr:DNA adenine methylase [Azonexus sp.]MDR0777788.1 DNA adenine methylase [Azonexus sp.]